MANNKNLPVVQGELGEGEPSCSPKIYVSNEEAALLAEMKRIDAAFLALLGVGALTAVLATSRLMSYLLDKHYAPSYAFFWGLVLVSMIFPYKYLKRRTYRELISFVLAAALTISLTN